MTGGKLRPWQIGLFVVALIAVGVAVAFSLRGSGPPLSKHVVLVDVTTGELFDLSTKGGMGAVIPELHPDTKQPVLLPTTEKDGKWTVQQRFLQTLGPGVKATAIGSDGTVTVSSKPRRTLEKRRS